MIKLVSTSVKKRKEIRQMTFEALEFLFLLLSNPGEKNIFVKLINLSREHYVVSPLCLNDHLMKRFVKKATMSDKSS